MNHLRITRPSFVFLAALSLMSEEARAVNGDEKTSQTQINVMAEIDFAAAVKHDDPFNTVTLDAVFTTPSGKLLRVPAFWAGGDKWKVRYASPEVGTHRFQTECSSTSDTGLHGVKGAVEIAPYTGDNPLYKH